jgi:hypothetical protein
VVGVSVDMISGGPCGSNEDDFIFSIKEVHRSDNSSDYLALPDAPTYLYWETRYLDMLLSQSWDLYYYIERIYFPVIICNT